MVKLTVNSLALIILLQNNSLMLLAGHDSQMLPPKVKLELLAFRHILFVLCIFVISEQL